MNEALLSSKNLSWCTPADFFAELDQEFHFDLDPAATDKSAKCARYFTPDDDGLKMDWGGVACSAILRMAARSATGCRKATRKARNRARSWLCSYLRGRTPHISTTTYCTGRPTRSASCGGGSNLRTRTETPRTRHPSPLLSLCGVARTCPECQGHGAGADPGRSYDGERDRGRSGWQGREGKPQRRGPDTHQSAGSRKSNKRRKAGVQRDGALRYRLEGRKRGINESNHRMAAMGRSYGCGY